MLRCDMGGTGSSQITAVLGTRARSVASAVRSNVRVVSEAGMTFYSVCCVRHGTYKHLTEESGEGSWEVDSTVRVRDDGVLH